MISRKSSPNIYYVRNMCLGADTSRGSDQKPFNGKLDYDWLMWIDSDIIYQPNQIITLLRHDKEIVSGLYLMDNNTHYATCKTWDEDHFKTHGYFPFLSRDDLNGSKQLQEVAYTGFGFILIKKGVFEKMEYPWFRPEFQKIGNSVDFTMEDVSFCLNAKEKGFKVLVDPQFIVGHEKKMVLT